jgi:hypothetical protein
MSFVMVVDAARKVKYLEPDGREVYDDEDPYLFLRYEAAGILKAGKRKQPDSGEGGAPTT